MSITPPDPENVKRDKPLRWVGGSRKDLREFPKAVRYVIGTALLQAQKGGKHAAAKVLHGFGGGGVLEVVEDDHGGTYRAVYTVRFPGAVYVLHAFQKKSKKGGKTPQRHTGLIKARLKEAKNDYDKRKQAEEEGR